MGIGMRKDFVRFFLMAASLVAMPAQAMQIVRMTPQGEVAQVRQVVVTFDEAVTAFGDGRARAPVTVKCGDTAAVKGSGRWTTERVWSYSFAQDLAPGVRCTVQAVAGLQSASGAALTGPTRFQFNTGGPFVQSVMPYPGSRIDEEQALILRLNGPAAPDSIQRHVWCGMQGLGERIAVRLIAGADRDALLRARHLQEQAKASPLQFVTLACNRRLTPSADLQLVFGKGVSTPDAAGAGGAIANAVEKRFDYTVREPFLADFQCERENAQADCLPIRPMRLEFNAPVARSLAQGIRLRAGEKVFQPVFETATPAGSDATVDGVAFASVLPASTRFQLELPAGLKDDAGRSLRNAESFPRTVATGPMPPLVKFAAAPFGIVERLAEPDGQAVLPVTLRNVESVLPARDLGLAGSGTASPGTVRDLQPATDAQIIAWYRKLQRYDDFSIPREVAAKDVQGPLPPALGERDQDSVQSRMVSLLQGRAGVRMLDLPSPTAGQTRPFEVIGIPLSPGFHVIEIASKVLGAALLDAGHGTPRPMFVRTSALVTNLGVHFKLGRAGALAWVTTLDSGEAVSNAQVQVSDCHGRAVAAAVTDRQGIARFSGLDPQAPRCDDASGYAQAYFVSARAVTGTPGRAGTGGAMMDLAFTWSDWHRGIEPWRFHLPTSQETQPDTRAHTVFDRTLLRAGETVSMKHLVRLETDKGLALPERRPDTVLITHVGSGQQSTQALAWRTTATGGLSAESVFAIPVAAKLGVYTVALRVGKEGREWPSGEFRVEAFRLPVLKGSIAPAAKGALVDPRTLPVNLQIAYVAGGGASGLPVQVSALLR
ncbi:MAG: MG2 domain-containing protein, partial [Burkholderiaceae bacterium]